MKYDILGKEFENKKGHKFIVLCQSGKNERSVALYDVKFLESGYIARGISSGHIRNGEVKDYLSPSVFGVGCLGYASGFATRKGSRRLYYAWRNMIRRCYDKNYSKYKYYGGIGVTVYERWHRLDLFIEDVINIPGFDEELFESGKLEMDKDIINHDALIYSPETCSLVSKEVNLQESLYRRWHKAS